jgi:hypothetical protein
MFSSILGEKRFRPDSPPRSADGLAQALGDEGLATLTSELKMFLRAELSDQLKSAVVEAITTLKTEIQIHIAAVIVKTVITVVIRSSLPSFFNCVRRDLYGSFMVLDIIR